MPSVKRAQCVRRNALMRANVLLKTFARKKERKMIIKMKSMNFNISKLLLGILLVMIFVACDEKKEQEEKE